MGIITVMILLSMMLNAFFMPRYYAYKMHSKLTNYTELIQEKGVVAVQEKAMTDGLVVVQADLDQDNDSLNEMVRFELQRQGVALSKFWITEESQKNIQQNQSIHKTYIQEKLKNQFKVEMFQQDGQLILLGTTLEGRSETTQIMTQFNLFLLVGGLLLAGILIPLFSRRFTQPLVELTKASQEIADQKFVTVAISTNDEMATLAQNMNEMSHKLEQSQQKLVDQNEQLKQFTLGLAHELKTPLSLIRMYTLGIQDGLDDGTYLDTIVKQTEDMDQMVQALLSLSKNEEVAPLFAQNDIVHLFEEELSYFETQMKQEHYQVIQNVPAEPLSRVLLVDRDKTKIIFSNLLTNAFKYSLDRKINVRWYEDKEHVLFEISNATSILSQQEVEKLWLPFYVGEPSRNKHFSGTGLGLSLVKKLAEQQHFKITATLNESTICFQLAFPKIA